MLKDNTYITITRQYGSGGKEIANIVAKKLGINCYDRKIVHLAAERFHNSTEPISNEVMEDLITTSYSMPGSLGDYSFESIPFYNKMFKEQSIAILKLAQKGSAVFLGRCSDYILKDYPNTFSFFIYADDDFRQNRAKDHYGNNTLEQLDKEDKNRKRYYAYYTGQTWGEAQWGHPPESPAAPHTLLHKGRAAPAEASARGRRLLRVPWPPPSQRR